MDGIEVIRVWTYIARNAGLFRRILDFLSFGVASFLIGLCQRCDLIIATSPQFFTTPTASALAWIKRRPWVFELRDIWPESIVAVGAMQRGWMIRWLERLELSMYHSANLIVPVTPAFRGYLIGQGVDSKKIVVVPNGADLTHYYPQPRNQGLIDYLGLWNKFVIVYIGTHGMAHGLDFIVSAMAEIKEIDAVCLMIGDGASKDELRAQANRIGAQRVLFIDPVPKSEVPTYLSIAHVALVNLRQSETFKSVIPSKIFEAAAMRVPILLGVDGQARELIEEFGAGVYFEPENSEEFHYQLRRLHDDQKLYKSLQDGAARLAARYDRARLATEMQVALESLVTRIESAGRGPR